MAEYYDYVLAFIPVALFGVTGALGALGVDPMAAIPVGAAVATLAVGHALFVNGPVTGDDPSVSSVPDSARIRSASDNSPVGSAADGPAVNAD